MARFLMVPVAASVFLLCTVALSLGSQVSFPAHQLSTPRLARRDFSRSSLKPGAVTGLWEESCAAAAMPTTVAGNRSAPHIAGPETQELDAILDGFLRQQAELSALLSNYTYHLTLDVREKWAARRAKGRHTQEWDVVFDDRGRRLAREITPAFDNLSGLPLRVASDSRRVIDELAPLSFDSGSRLKYSFTYLEYVQIGGLPAYEFRVTPLEVDKRRPQFLGVIWINAESLALIRAEGVMLPDASGIGNRVPMHFIESRAQLDGRHWFPVLEVGEVSSPGMTFHETVKFSNYKRFGSTVKLSFVD